MKPTRIPALVVIAVVCGAVIWLVLPSFYLSLPPLPWSMAIALGVLAAAEAWNGRVLRARLAGRVPQARPPHPIAVARLAAFAKATSLAGALVAGLAGGTFIYLSASLGKPAYRSDAIVAGVTFLVAAALIAAALYLEYGCRMPARGSRDGDGPAPGSSGPRR